MSTLVYVIALAAAMLLAALWAVVRTRRIRAASDAREAQALAVVLGRKGSIVEDEAFFGGAHTGVPASAGIEVAEVVDLDALLGGLPSGQAERARAQLEEPTRTNVGGIDSFLPATARTPWRPADLAPAPAAAPISAAAAPAAAGRPVAPSRAPSATSAASSGQSVSTGADVPLRELVLAWFEARGYRGAPASTAVHPIELVLRHKADPARAYAVVVESQPVTAERVRVLRAQARGIGLMRLLVVAAAGAAPGAADGMKGVRLIDHATLQGEFGQVDLTVAAKIVAVARRRAARKLAGQPPT